MPLLKCSKDGFYTLKPVCERCGGKTVSPGPAKYSPEDHYGKYRRLAKTQARERGRAPAS